MVKVRMSRVIKTMSERETIVSNLRHAVVVDKCSGNDENVEYLMTLKLQQYHQQLSSSTI